MTRDHDGFEDALQIQVRQALQARADQVQIAPDALARIRTRTTRRRRTWTISLASLATAATVAAAAVLVSGRPHEPVTRPVPPASQLPIPMPMPGESLRLPIYYVALAGGTPVLFREFHPAAPTSDAATTQDPTPHEATLPDRIRAAVKIMLTGQPFDPDYASDWPATVSVRAVTIESGIAVVDLTGVMPTGTAGASALEQLVWTVTAVAADQGVQLDGVMVRHDGKARSDEPLTRGLALETLAPVWLISPQQGDTVGNTVDVHVAAVRGATIRLRVRDATGAQLSDEAVNIVASTTAPATTGTAGAAVASRGEAHVLMTLPPGRYTLEAYELSADGDLVALDNHTITVSPAVGKDSGG